MAATNHERVGRGLGLLKDGLGPFFEQQLSAEIGAKWQDEVGLRDGDPDTYAILKTMRDQWNRAFGKILGKAERNLVHELLDVRNRWAHQETFSTDDTYRALDSVHRLLTSVSAADEASEAGKLKQEILRRQFEEEARQERRRVASTAIEGKPSEGLKPWREVVTPHEDVASGRYRQAEFAADLGQVHRGEGESEYRDPKEFFRRTFLTDGLRMLLRDALLRLSGKGGDPVIQLQTNFGGGKTHSMLALYHLFSGVSPAELSGVEAVIAEADGATPPKAKAAVLVGTALSPSQPHAKDDGTETRTLWGELAWQLLGKKGYEAVAEADRTGTSPGSDAFRKILQEAAPCLILIDEWIAYVRQTYGKDGLAAGSFDANMTFAQSLTEAVRQVNGALLVASIPASDIEIGGEGGKTALERLSNVFGRMDSPWRPATADEGFEIVRRRLFQLVDPGLHRARDAVIEEFSRLYMSQRTEFPSDCREGVYKERLQNAYPLHPELFDRLYEDWSTLEKFQRTRGVLRLMAAVIHALWEADDRSLMILPASVPVSAVHDEMARYLEENWPPVIDADVDGPNSLPLRLDRENPNLGRYSACRRVARTIYVGSAPTKNAANRGLEENRIRLGCVQPGESVATFGDALRRLTSQATYLYGGNGRYWYDTRASAAKTARDRKDQLLRDRDGIDESIRKWVRETHKQRGDFAKVHAFPESSADVPDEREARLVILGPETPHDPKAKEQSRARVAAAEILQNRGASPRIYRNTLVFLAPEARRLEELADAVADHLAWSSILQDRKALNLDEWQADQAEGKRRESEETVRQRIPETFSQVLVPFQETGKPEIQWREIRVQGNNELAVRTSRKLGTEECLMTEFGAVRLRLELDRVPLWRGDHVSLKQLAEDFAQYLYLSRLKDPSLLLQAVEEGVKLLTWKDDAFAYAEGYDEAKGRYQALRAGGQVTPRLDTDALVVKPEVAAPQIEADRRENPPVSGPAEGQPNASDDLRSAEEPSGVPPPPPEEKKPRRFHGTVNLNALRAARDAGTITQEVVQHLSSLPGANVEITMEIHADIPEGADDRTVRVVTENCRTLKFKGFGFEEK